MIIDSVGIAAAFDSGNECVWRQARVGNHRRRMCLIGDLHQPNPRPSSCDAEFFFFDFTIVIREQAGWQNGVAKGR